MQFPEGVLIGVFTKQGSSTTPGLEMNTQEKKKKSCLKMQDTSKEPAKSQTSKD